MDQYLLGLLSSINSAKIGYTAAKYFIFVAIVALLYYLFPRKNRWVILLIANIFFYYEITTDKKQLFVFAVSIIICYFGGLLIQKKSIQRRKTFKKLLLGIGIAISTAPLIVSKFGELLIVSTIHRPTFSWIIPVGLSFYSMQLISYLIDVYRGKYISQRNILKFALYVSFFPIIIQGPISRYEQLGSQLYKGHDYNTENIMRGIQLILWGLFLKYLIADKASVVVNTVFDNYQDYSGFYILLAAILYSIQLYTDFLSCVNISQGVAELFGIELSDNFNHPYFSTSIKEFWRRWHISLSEWLKDYIYIPLGGSRKGRLHKYVNIIITFIVSGIWHGGCWKYIFWGLLHGSYQIVGDIIYGPKNFILEKMSLKQETFTRRVLDMIVTSFLVMVAWIFFRADSLKIGIRMFISMLNTFNLWILFDNSIFRLGLDQKEFGVLFVSILVLILVSLLQEKGIKIRDWFNRQNTVLRWLIYLGLIWTIWIFGTYGYGFNSSDFIYGGF